MFLPSSLHHQMDWVICEETIRTMYSDFGAPVNDVAIHKYAIEQVHIPWIHLPVLCSVLDSFYLA